MILLNLTLYIKLSPTLNIAEIKKASETMLLKTVSGGGADRLATLCFH